jgi:hypothetical protein
MRLTARLIRASQKFTAGVPVENSEICTPAFVDAHPRWHLAARHGLQPRDSRQILSIDITAGLRNRRQISGLGFQSEL